GDNKTNVINPTFDISNVLKGATVSLFRAGLSTPVRTLSNVAGGTIQIQDPGPLANGVYSYTVVQTNVAGTASPTGPAGGPLHITIDTPPPPVPSVLFLSLDGASDTGVKGDGTTSARLLTIDGTADPGVVIKLYDVTGGAVGTPGAKFIGTT